MRVTYQTSNSSVRSIFSCIYKTAFWISKLEWNPRLILQLVNTNVFWTRITILLLHHEESCAWRAIPSPNPHSTSPWACFRLPANMSSKRQHFLGSCSTLLPVVIRSFVLQALI